MLRPSPETKPARAKNRKRKFSLTMFSSIKQGTAKGRKAFNHNREKGSKAYTGD